MAYTNFQNCTLQEYKDIIYSQSETNDLKIYFNGVEYPNIGEKCEKIEITSRIMPDDGKKTFYLDNFISREINIILHEVDVEDIVEPITISIGTLVDETNQVYEYVPLGIFNIQNTPVNDKGKVTVKLRDNSVKFDFNYDASTLIETTGGSVSLSAILTDICEKANITNSVGDFYGADIEVGIYDNTISARTYISYIAEQAGMIPTINRDGELIFIDLSNLYTWEIPLEVVEKYELEEPFTIERVVYESGRIKYETSNIETLSTLYIDAANPYVNTQEQVNNILTLLENFQIDSVTTGKVLGNPAIDPYDLMQIIDTENNDAVVFTTLANCTYTFSGNNRQVFKTQIGKEQRKENVSIKTETANRKIARTEIDLINGTISDITEDVLILQNDNDTNKSNISTITNNVTRLQTSTYSKIQVQQMQSGNNYFTTEDEKFTDTTNYYKKVNDSYVLLAKGTDYNVGDLVNEIGFAVYEFGEITTVRNEIGTFSDEGLRIEKKGSDDDRNTIGIYNEKGVQILNYDESDEIFFSGYVDDNRFGEIYQGDTLVYTKNLISKGYTEVGVHGRFEEYPGPNNENGVGFFVI